MTTTEDLSVHIFGTEVLLDDVAKFNYASTIKHLRNVEFALPSAEFDKIRTQMVSVVDLTYSSTLGQLHGDDDIWYSDGTPVIHLVRATKMFGGLRVRILPSGPRVIPDAEEHYGSLAELVGEYEPPAGWAIEVAEPPRTIPATKRGT